MAIPSPDMGRTSFPLKVELQSSSRSMVMKRMMSPTMGIITAAHMQKEPMSWKGLVIPLVMTQRKM